MAEPRRAVRRQRLAAHSLFFPAATLLAIVGPPLWVAGRLPLDPAGHAHEMLMGFAVGSIAGFLITKAQPWAILLAFALWLAARLGAVGLLPWPEVSAAAASAGFLLLLFLLAGLPFLKAARGHNLVFAPILAVLLLADLGYQAGRLTDRATMPDRAVLAMTDGVAAMMFVMGGRILAGLAAGTLRRQGLAVRHAAHLPWEWLVVAGLATAVAADILAWPPAATVGLAVAGAAALIRLILWRGWRLLAEAETAPLVVGYGWLAAGLLLPLTGWLPRLDAVHAITIGALGTLAQTIMLRTVMLRRRCLGPLPLASRLGLALVGVATLSRLLMPVIGGPALTAAAAAWGSAFALHLAVLLRLSGRPTAGGGGQEPASKR